MTNELTYEQETVRAVFGAYINDLKVYSSKPDRPTLRKLEEVRNKAIKALEQQPSEDCISRQAVLDIWHTTYSNVRIENEEIQYKKIAYELPPVTPQRPKGHNENNDYAECDQFVCSECGIELQDWHRVERDIDDGDITYHEYTFKYCPNCGAEMED